MPPSMGLCSNGVMVRRNLSALSSRFVEPVGKSYEAFICRRHHKSSSSHGIEKGHVSEDITVEDDIDFLRSLDPKTWKDQDHYKVLGIKDLRHKASDDDIKKAYRAKVLRHHPDKRRALGEEIREDDDYFTCITRAYEILGNISKRQAYDSVDPLFDDSIPSVSAKSKEDFYEIFDPIFSRNARWSMLHPVPELGNTDSSRQYVEEFYNFWFEFQSWREFSYLDEEDKEKGQDRDERRWIEKQNKAARARRRKEEVARLRQLVENAYTCDPRIRAFQDAEKKAKEAAKKAKQDAIRARHEEEERKKQEALDAERKAKEAAEAEEKTKQEAVKKEKEAAKKALKKERKQLRNTCKDHSYFAKEPSQSVENMAELDKICELYTIENLVLLNKRLQGCSFETGQEIFLGEVEAMNKKIKEENEALARSVSKGRTGGKDEKGTKKWNNDDLQLLIKAVNLFPAGTNQRWEVVANFINQHSKSTCERTAKDVLAQAKLLQGSDHSSSQLKAVANQKAYQNFQKDQKASVSSKVDDVKASERYETPAEQQGINPLPWTAEEQKLLEQALKTYPSSTTDRWDRISECIPNRSRKDCMKRYKELADMVRAKKAAQAAANKAK